jgi:hypothetical protein
METSRPRTSSFSTGITVTEIPSILKEMSFTRQRHCTFYHDEQEEEERQLQEEAPRFTLRNHQKYYW